VARRSFASQTPRSSATAWRSSSTSARNNRRLLAIIGDTHLPRGRRRLPEACVALLREAELILHTGDLTSLEALVELERIGPTWAVVGNADEPLARERLPERLELEHDGLRIALVHSGGPRARRHERLRAWFPDAELIAYGHTHLPEIARSDSCWIVNPGSPTERRRAPGRTMVVVEGGIPALIEV
jgi:putative phosphoesterase